MRSTRQTSLFAARVTVLGAGLLTATLLQCAACGGLEPPAEQIAARPIDTVSDDEAAPAAAPAKIERELFALNADQTRVVLLLVQIDDPASLPVEEPIEIGSEGAVRAVVRASGNIPSQSPACQFLDNPLPDDVNPCADTVTLYENPQPTPLDGVLVLTSNDDVISGNVSAFWGEDDAVYGSF